MSSARKQIIGPLTKQQLDWLVSDFHDAASGRRGKVRRMKTLIAQGAPLDAQDEVGWTALHYAANQGNIGGVRALLEAGATVDIREGDGMTPLMRAASNGHNDIIALLVKHGADPRATAEDGRNAMMLASSEGFLKTVRYLARLGVAVDAKTSGGQTARDIALSRRQDEIANFLAQEQLLKAIAAGAPSDSGINGFTALHYATLGGETADLRKTLAAGVPVDARSDLGVTPLMLAATADFRREAAAVLVKKGADVQAVNNDGHTPLMIAALMGAYDTVHLLLDKGAAPDAADRDGHTAAILARDNGYPHLAEKLFEATTAYRERKEAENIRAATVLGQRISVGAPLRFR